MSNDCEKLKKKFLTNEKVTRKNLFAVCTLTAIFHYGAIAQLPLNVSYSGNAIPRYGGYGNTAFGLDVLNFNTGAYNTAIGNGALNRSLTGEKNTATGAQALYYNTGSYNTAYGVLALYGNGAGNQNTAIGCGADVTSAELTNATAIGFGAQVRQSYSIQLGNHDVTQIFAGTGNATLIAGKLQITGGVPVAGKVLTSDALGNATWQTPAQILDANGNLNTSPGFFLGKGLNDNLTLKMHTGNNANWKRIGVDGNLAFWTDGNVGNNSNPQMILQSSGNLGIGTTTPRAKLELNSGVIGTAGLQFTQLNSNSATAVANGKVLTVDADGKVILVPDAASSFRNLWGSVNSLELDGDGLAKINGNSASPNPTLFLSPFGWGSSTYGKIKFGDDKHYIQATYAKGMEIRDVDAIAFNTDGDFSFRTNNYNNTNTSANLVSIKNNGYVGIGTANPNYQLTVRADGSGIMQESPNGKKKLGFYTDNVNLYVQTLTNDPLRFSTNGGITQMILTTDGNVGIGTTLWQNPNNYKLAVNGTIGAKEVQVENTSKAWADYVFDNDYKLKSLTEVEAFVKEKKHLPEIPSKKEVEQNGHNLGEMDVLLLKKIEELTLYIIEQNKRIEALEKEKTLLK